MNSFKTGPSIILNSGSLNQSTLGKTDKYGKYSTAYVMGLGNRSFRELKRIVEELAPEGVKMPWRVDEKTQMVSIFASNKKPVPVLGPDGKRLDVSVARDGEFCKLNVTPASYMIEEDVTYRLPDGSMGQQQVTKSGVKLFLNGIKMLDSTKDEELF